jgi:hypothetical protein
LLRRCVEVDEHAEEVAHRPQAVAPVERRDSLVGGGASCAKHGAGSSTLDRAALRDVEELLADLFVAELRMQDDPAPEERVVDRGVLELRERGQPAVGELRQPPLGGRVREPLMHFVGAGGVFAPHRATVSIRELEHRGLVVGPRRPDRPVSRH